MFSRARSVHVCSSWFEGRACASALESLGGVCGKLGAGLAVNEPPACVCLYQVL